MEVSGGSLNQDQADTKQLFSPARGENKNLGKDPVQEVLDRRVPALCLAQTLGQHVVSTKREATMLKARAQLLKEDITREATQRLLQMQEGEENWVLDLALSALGGVAGSGPVSPENARAARDLLIERRAVLRRRRGLDVSTANVAQPAPANSARVVSVETRDDICEEGVNPASTTVERQVKDVIAASAGGSVEHSIAHEEETNLTETRAPFFPDPRPPIGTSSSSAILQPSYWRDLTDLKISTSSQEFQSFMSRFSRGEGLHVDSLEVSGKMLDEHGWCATGVLSTSFETVAGRLHQASLRLRAAGWPPAFVFMFDEAWCLASIAQAAASHLLVPTDETASWAWRLEPSFAAFLLDRGHATENGKDGKKKNHGLGNCFPLPHRDHCYSSCFDANGKPKLVSLWIPLNDVAVDTGCMYVVPKEFDPIFSSDAAYEHMQLLSEAAVSVENDLQENENTKSKFTATTVCGFPLAGARPLPCQRGTMLAWNSNLVHWGSFCHSDATACPRSSVALVVRRCRVSEADPAQIQNPEDEPWDMEAPEMLSKLASVQQRLRLVMSALRYFEHWYDTGPVHDRVVNALRKSSTENALQ